MDTKYCKRCDQTLPRDRFTKAAGRYDGLQAYCRECMKLFRREHYYNNKQPYKDRARIQTQAAKDIIRWYKQTNPCVDCGDTHFEEPWLLEFDHVDSESKLFSITRAVSSGQKAVMEEMEKCELVCVRCHRRRTASRAGWKHLVDKPENYWYDD